jgi:hypothetical protein
VTPIPRMRAASGLTGGRGGADGPNRLRRCTQIVGCHVCSGARHESSSSCVTHAHIAADHARPTSMAWRGRVSRTPIRLPRNVTAACRPVARTFRRSGSERLTPVSGSPRSETDGVVVLPRRSVRI